jgi:uncharacterized protein with beta-barrel porin domain
MGASMGSIHSKLLFAIGVLALTMMTPNAEALTNIPNGDTVTAPPQANDVMNFQAPAPGGTFVIEPGVTFSGAITNSAAGIGTLVLNSGSQLNGAVATGVSPLLQVTLNGSATIIGATSAQNFNLGQNTLTNTGALNLPSGIVLNTRVVTNALFGHIAASGADSIAGASVLVNVDASGVVALTPGQPLFVVSAAGTTSGLPVHVTSNSVLYSFIGNNLNGNITITPTLNPALSLPGGAGAVFTALLQVAANNPGSDIAAVVAAISALPTAEAIKEALSQLNPQAEGALTRMSFESAKQFQQIWALHMTNGRCVYAQKCDRCHTRDEHGKSISRAKRAECKKKRNCDCDSSIHCDSVSNRWEVWADGFGLWGHQDKHDGFHGYNAKLYGGMLAAQGPIFRELSAGLGSGYANTEIHRAHDNNSRINMYDATAYLSYNPTRWYMDTSFSFDYNHYHDDRHIKFPGINRTAKANYNGQQYTGLLAGGYRFYKWCSIFTPLTSLQYSHLHVNKYHEHGAGDLNLHVKKQNYNFLESSLGLKAARPIQTRHGVIVPEMHGLWLYDFFSDSMGVRSTFSGVAAEAGQFKTQGPGLARNRGDVGAGITFISCIDLAVEAVYNYEFSKRWHAHDGLIKISQQF